jgi:hypothetical protein
MVFSPGLGALQIDKFQNPFPTNFINFSKIFSKYLNRLPHIARYKSAKHTTICFVSYKKGGAGGTLVVPMAGRSSLKPCIFQRSTENGNG